MAIDGMLGGLLVSTLDGVGSRQAGEGQGAEGETGSRHC